MRKYQHTNKQENTLHYLAVASVVYPHFKPQLDVKNSSKSQFTSLRTSDDFEV